MKEVRQPNHHTKEDIQMDNNSLSHTTWNCKYHIVFAPTVLKHNVGLC